MQDGKDFCVVHPRRPNDAKGPDLPFVDTIGSGDHAHVFELGDLVFLADADGELHVAPPRKQLIQRILRFQQRQKVPRLVDILIFRVVEDVLCATQHHFALGLCLQIRHHGV